MTSLGWRKSRKFRDASQAVERPVSARPDYGGCSAILQSRFVLSRTGRRQSRSASASGTRDVPDRSWPRDVAPTAWSRSSARRPWAGLPPLAPKAASRSPGEPRPLGRGLARYLAPRQRRPAPLAATARAREGRSPSERVSAFPSERGRTAPTGGRAVTFAQPDAARRRSWRRAMEQAPCWRCQTPLLPDHGGRGLRRWRCGRRAAAGTRRSPARNRRRCRAGW